MRLRHQLELISERVEAFEAGKKLGAAEIFADIEKALDNHFTKLDFGNGTCTFIFHRDLEIELAELRKKYGV